MDWKRGFGIGLMFVGVYLIFINGSITGNVIGIGEVNAMGMLGVVVFIVGILFIFSSVVLEDRVSSVETIEEDDSPSGEDELDVAKSDGMTDHYLSRKPSSYQKLVNRLSEMEKHKMVGVSPDMPKGRYLDLDDEVFIANNIMGYLPRDVANSDDLEISISGSLSREKKGQRMSGKFGIDESFKSDDFYLSDIDVNIVGKKAFDYIEANWGSAIVRASNKKGHGGGKLKNVTTYKISTEEFLDEREKGRGYMNDAPAWMNKLLKVLSENKYAGEQRPVNIKFYANKDVIGGVPRDILYDNK